MGSKKNNLTDGKLSSKDRPLSFESNDEQKRLRSLRKAATTIVEAANRLEHSLPVSEDTALEEICDDLRQLATALEAVSHPQLSDGVIKLIEICAKIADETPPQEHKLHQTATHHLPLAPGGLGYIMTLSDEEQKQIDWGGETKPDV